MEEQGAEHILRDGREQTSGQIDMGHKEKE